MISRNQHVAWYHRVTRMKRDALFSLTLIATMLVVRMSVFWFPQRHLVIDGTLIHHFWIGIVLVLAVILIPKHYPRLAIVLSALGLGLVADELAYIVLGDGAVRQYWSIPSIAGAVIIAALLVVFRKKFIHLFYV